jgi:hypothetical protein
MAIAGTACLSAGLGFYRAPAAHAEGLDPCAASSADWCLGSEQGGGSSTGGGRSSGGGGDPASDACGWETVPAEVVPPASSTRPVILANGRPPEGQAVVWQAWCYSRRVALQQFRGPFRWLPAGDAASLTAEDVARAAYDRLKGRMPTPEVVTTPPPGVEAVVDVPVFVTITNWQTEIVDGGDLLGNAVTVRATPALLVDPAEPGASAFECSGPGRPYDPAGGDLWQQAAADGACTHTYRHRTDVDGRGQEWPSTVTVRWTITWSADSGEGGTFPAVNRTVSIPRSVDEVQAVVVEGAR